MIRVAIAARTEIARKGLEALIRASPIFKYLGSTSTRAALLGSVSDGLRPDVVLLEMTRAETNDGLPTVGEELGAPRFVILTDDPDGAWVSRALRAGVRAVLSVEASSDEIVAAIQAVAAGFVVIDPGKLNRLLPAAQPVSDMDSEVLHQALSPREIEVLRMLAEGVGNKEIAWRLKISEHTVKFHINSIFLKLDASTRTEAVTIGIRRGLISI